MDFNDAASIPFEQEVNCKYTLTDQKSLEITVKPYKFQNVTHLTLFIPQNIQQATTTRLSRLVLFGCPFDPALVSISAPITKAPKKKKPFIPKPKTQHQKSEKSQLQDEALLVFPHAMTISDKGYIDIDISKFKALFYEKKNHISSEEQKHDMIHHYLQGLVWILAYYYTGNISWSWSYPYYYAPFASDLVSFLNTHSMSFDFKKDAPVSLLEQLLSVLPPTSAELIPHIQAKDLMMQRKDLFPDPTQISIDIEGRKDKWDMIIHLPLPNLAQLRESLDVHKEQQGHTYRFRYDANVKYLFPSTIAVFPDIDDCHCKVDEI
jgi:5'-3' exonuclease